MTPWHAQTEIPRLASPLPFQNLFSSSLRYRSLSPSPASTQPPALTLSSPPSRFKPSSMASSLVFGIALLLVITSSETREFLVGGANTAWQIPPNTTDSLNHLEVRSSKRLGAAVLEMTRKAYLSCNRSQLLAEHKDGTTAVELRRSGAYYFISGAAGACNEGQRLIVVVMSPRPPRAAGPGTSTRKERGPSRGIHQRHHGHNHPDGI
ncbi:hypothetical protein ZIOFF_037874 [Zingiber officinale]|uniref:Phytocyanin domain-containing protein n=1 Tax=Zingiber officinale TaxID=94328 RepID=A0A8J5GC64_ZINOF|nr:hypothetical protein ZIOFF_037874 [Zingiber officinale]